MVLSALPHALRVKRVQLTWTRGPRLHVKPVLLAPTLIVASLLAQRARLARSIKTPIQHLRAPHAAQGSTVQKVRSRARIVQQEKLTWTLTQGRPVPRAAAGSTLPLA
jgi:hypothetical protein